MTAVTTLATTPTLETPNLKTPANIDAIEASVTDVPVEPVQPDFHVSPRVAAISAGVLGVSALAFYIYGHLPGA